MLKCFGPLKFQNHGVVIESYRKGELWTTRISIYFLAGQALAGYLPKSMVGSNSVLLEVTSGISKFFGFLKRANHRNL